MHENEPHLWLFVKQEEQKQIVTGFGRRTSGNIITETRYHLDLQSHDARTTERIWKKRLLTLKDNEGGHNAQARILGQDGDVVWLFVSDQPVAVSSSDGSVLADRKLIEQRNSALQGIVPKELNFYTFDNGLVITAADARRYKVRATDYVAEPYKPANEEQFSRMQFMSSTWNGGYHTSDFLTRMATLGGRWLGLFTQRKKPPPRAMTASVIISKTQLKSSTKVRVRDGLFGPRGSVGRKNSAKAATIDSSMLRGCLALRIFGSRFVDQAGDEETAVGFTTRRDCSCSSHVSTLRDSLP